jgi:hypothetical protein
MRGQTNKENTEPKNLGNLRHCVTYDYSLLTYKVSCRQNYVLNQKDRAQEGTPPKRERAQEETSIEVSILHFRSRTIGVSLRSEAFLFHQSRDY